MSRSEEDAPEDDDLAAHRARIREIIEEHRPVFDALDE